MSRILPDILHPTGEDLLVMNGFLFQQINGSAKINQMGDPVGTITITTLNVRHVSRWAEYAVVTVDHDSFDTTSPIDITYRRNTMPANLHKLIYGDDQS